jgi:hypothetical protein
MTTEKKIQIVHKVDLEDYKKEFKEDSIIETWCGIFYPKYITWRWTRVNCKKCLEARHTK